MRDRRVDRLVAPRAGDGFRARLDARIRQTQRAQARRWRVAALALAATTLAGIASAGVLALSTGAAVVDKTISCPLVVTGGIPEFLLLANAQGRNGSGPFGAFLLVGTGDQAIRSPFVSIDSGKSGYVVDHLACTKSATKAPLTPSGLPTTGTFRKNSLQSLGKLCWAASAVTIHVHIALSKSGVAKTAQVAIRTGKKNRPVAFIDWTPTLVKTYGSSDCHDR